MTEAEKHASIEKAIAGYRENVEKNIAAFWEKCDAKMAGEGEFSIGTIEEIWGDILRSNEKVTEELLEEAANGIVEKELVKKKLRKLEREAEKRGTAGSRRRAFKRYTG